VFGIESHITSCNNEFAGRVAGNATGQIFEQVLTGASCSRQACKTGSEGNPWPASGSENTAGVSPQGFLTTNFCVEPVGGGTDETCEIDVPFNSYSNQHRQEYGQVGEMSSHGISGFRCELVGHWNSETGGTHDGQAEQEGVITHGGGGGGGGGSWSIDIQPDSWTFSDTTTFKDFKIKNTGTNSWKVRSGGAEVTTGFYGEDPNGCLNPSKTYNPGTECTMKVRAQQLGKTGKIQVQNDHYVTDYSPLWS
jgi:hypothetical protein